MRRTGSALASEMADALESALRDVGVIAVRRPAPPGDGDRPDLVLDIGGQLVAVEIKSVVSETDALSVVDQLGRYGGPWIVAAERIAEGAKDQFIKAGVGFYDRRGRVRLVVPGITFVDAMTPRAESRSAAGVPLGGEVAKEVALVLLSDPAHRRGVRELARTVVRSPSSVFEALRGLQSAGLVTSANEPLVPDLFWELEAHWHRQVYPLAAVPAAFSASVTDLLQLGLGHGPDGRGWELDVEGWALTGTLAAVAWGVPLVSPPTYPPDFYVPSLALLHRAFATLGKAPSMDERACTVSTAPARLVCRRRFDRGSIWPVADHVVVALDLAKDQSRGREALERWRPEGTVRVW